MLQPMQDDLFGAPPSPPPSPPSSAPASPAASAAPGGRKPASRKAVGAVQLAPQALQWQALADRLPQGLRMGVSTWSYPGWEGLIWDGAYDKSRSEEHTSELQSPCNLVCRLLLEKQKRESAP